MSVKTEKLENQLIQELSYIINYEVKDKDVRYVTVTACTLSPDLSYAKVYITCLNDKYKNKTVEALNKVSKFIRYQLANKVNLRYTPALTFVYDESIAYAKHIENIIEQVKEDK